MRNIPLHLYITILDLSRALEANDLDLIKSYVSHMTPADMSLLKEYLLECIANNRREYEPVETTPTWDEAWFSSDMREVEQWAFRFIQPKSMTMN